MVPEIKNLKILEPTILEHAQDHFFGRAVFHGESAATFSFGKNYDFEGVSPNTRSPISVPRFRRYLRTDSTQATQKFQHRDTIMWKYFFFGNSKLLPFYGIKSEFNHFISMTVNFPPSIAYAHVHLLW